MREGRGCVPRKMGRGRLPVSRPLVALLSALALGIAACSGATEETADSSEAAGNAAAASAEPSQASADLAAAAPAADCPDPDVESDMEMFDISTAQFSDPAEIDATYLPMTPGTQHTYEGQALEDGEELARKVIFTVTDLTKVVGGVESVVIWEQDFNDDELVESELGFFAQDDEGTVWHTGEYYELWEEGEFVGSRFWGAGEPPCTLAGVQMWAEPEPGMSTYSQGFAPEPFYWADRATIDEIKGEHCVPVDCYNDVLVTEESDEADPDATQLKFYAPGIGNVAVGWRGDDPEQEELELVERTELDDAEMAEVRDEALAMEQRGSLYANQPPIQQREAASQ